MLKGGKSILGDLPDWFFGPLHVVEMKVYIRLVFAKTYRTLDCEPAVDETKSVGLFKYMHACIYAVLITD